jgi:hypothetical protein
MSFIGSAGAAASSVTLPTHQTGDLLVVYAYNDSSTTIPSIPSGWEFGGAHGGNTNGCRLAWRIATSSSESSGTWTNATGIIAHVYRNRSFGAASIFSGGNSTSLSFNSLTLTDTSGSSLIGLMAASRSTDNLSGMAPSGFQHRQSVNNAANPQMVSYDSTSGVSSFAGVTITTSNSGNRKTASFELVSTGLVADLSVTLGAMTVSSAGVVETPNAAVLNTTFGSLTLSASGVLGGIIFADPVAPLGGFPIGEPYGRILESNAVLDVTLGALSLSSTGGVSTIATLTKTLDALTLSAAGQVGATIGILTQTLGALTLSSTASLPTIGDSSVAFGTLTLSSTGSLPTVGSLSTTLGALSLASTMSADIGGSLTQTLGALSLASTASLPIGASLTTTLGALTLVSAGGTVPGVLVLSVTLGELQLSSTASVSIVGDFNTYDVVNYARASDNLADAVWIKQNVTVIEDQVTGSDGVSMADFVAEATGTNFHRLVVSGDCVNGELICFSIEVEPVGRRYFNIRATLTNTLCNNVFDLQEGSVLYQTDAAYLVGMLDLGGGKWRLWIARNATKNITGAAMYYISATPNAVSNSAQDGWVGDPTKGWYGCNAQIERGVLTPGPYVAADTQDGIILRALSVSLVSTATGALAADLSTTLGTLTLSSAVAGLGQASLTTNLGTLTLTATGQSDIQITLAKTLGVLTLSASSATTSTGTLTKTLSPLTCLSTARALRRRILIHTSSIKEAA